MRSPSPPSGFGLVEVLIAGAISAILAVGFSRVFVSQFKAQAKVGLDTDREALKLMLLDSIACRESNTPPLCPAAGAIALRRKTPTGSTPFISNAGAGTKFGPFTVKAECDPGGLGFVLRLARLSGTGTLTSTVDADFLPDPLTKRIIKWSDAASLVYGQGINVCTAFNGPGYTYLGARTVYTASVAALAVTAPEKTSLIKIHLVGNNLAGYPTVGGVDLNWLTEDKVETQIVANLDSATSTGYYSVIGGSGDAATVLFTWNDKPFSSMSGLVGDTDGGGYGTSLASSFRPVFTYNSTSRVFAFSSMPLYSPAQYAWMFEFYGQ